MRRSYVCDSGQNETWARGTTSFFFVSFAFWLWWGLCQAVLLPSLLCIFSWCASCQSQLFVALCRVVLLLVVLHCLHLSFFLSSILVLKVMESSSSTPPSVNAPWWQQPAPRLHATDSEEHVASITSTYFGLGLGVDMTSFLSPTRNVIASLTQIELDEYKKRSSFLNYILPLIMFSTRP